MYGGFKSNDGAKQAAGLSSWNEADESLSIAVQLVPNK